MRLVDLSTPIENSPPDVPEFLRTEIEYSGHEAGAAQVEQMLGVPRKLLRDGEGWATEEIRRLGTHNSTHVDAPWHYNSHIRGARAQTIDELPLEWFYGAGSRGGRDRQGRRRVRGRGGSGGRARRVPPHARAARHRARAHRPRCVLRAAGLPRPRPRRHRGRHAVAVRARGARDGDRRVGLGRPAALPGRGGQAGRRSGSVLGRAPGGPAVLADRAPREPEQAAADRASRSPASR